MSFFNKIGVLHKARGFDATAEMKSYFAKDINKYEIPEGVTEIRPYCFYNIWPEGGLSIKLPKTLKRIAPYAFSECALYEIEIPGSVVEISNNAFYGAPLKKATIGEGVRVIGNQAFMFGPSLEYLVIPDSVEKIGDEAFAGMDSDDGAIIEIGSGIKSIGKSAFECPVKSLVIHRKYGVFPDGSSGFFDDKGEWTDPVWYGGYTQNPLAIWDGDEDDD